MLEHLSLVYHGPSGRCSHRNCLQLHLATQFTFATCKKSIFVTLISVLCVYLPSVSLMHIAVGRLSPHGCIRALTRNGGTFVSKGHKHKRTFACVGMLTILHTVVHHNSASVHACTDTCTDVKLGLLMEQ